MSEQDSMSKVQDLLDSITNIQQQEDKLISEMKSGGGNSSNLVNVLNNLSNTRIQLYQTLLQDFKNVVGKNKNTSQALNDKLTLQGVVESNLNASKAQLETLIHNKNHKLRMIEINTFYNKRYKARVNFVKLIIKILIAILICSVVKQFGIIPNNIISIMFLLILLVGGILTIRSLYYLIGRNNMVYDEFDFMGEIRPSNESIWEYNKKHFLDPLKSGLKNLPGEITGAGCIGANCCSQGTIWNSNNQKCEINKSSSNTGDADGSGSGAGAGGTGADASADASAGASAGASASASAGAGAGAGGS